MEKYIIHIDMDAFFASIEQRDNPALKNKPVIIGSDPKNGTGRGVVSTCSYEARKFGIHSALPISIAYRKCPHGHFLHPDMGKYSNVSEQIFSILTDFTPDIEPISIDEAFMDISGSYQFFGTPIETCKKVKEKIKQELRLTSSIGLAPNKMIAKIASDIEKPNGLTIVSEKDLIPFLHGLPVNKLWGIGEKTAKELKSAGIYTVGDIAKSDMNYMSSHFGKNGIHLWNLSNGIDPRKVKISNTVSSISNEYTFEKDTNLKEDILDTLMYLSEKVARRLRKSGLRGKTVTLKIRFSDFSTFTRSISVNKHISFSDELYNISVKKLSEFNANKKPIRLLGIKVSNFEDNAYNCDLFTEKNNKETKKENLNLAIDRIQDKYGEGTVGRRNVC